MKDQPQKGTKGSREKTAALVRVNQIKSLVLLVPFRG
jgi:hypothetical protein